MSVRERNINELYCSKLFRKAVKMGVVLSGYAAFKERENNIRLLKKDFSYKHAERTSDLIKLLFNRNIKPESLMFSQNELANNIIRANELYMMFVKEFNQFDRSVLDAFYHHIYYRYKSLGNPLDDFVTWPRMIRCFTEYATLKISISELKSKIGYMSLLTESFVATDSVFFRQDMICLHDIYINIYRKKVKRSKGPIRNGIRFSMINMEA